MIVAIEGNWGPWYAEITPRPNGRLDMYRVEFVRDNMAGVFAIGYDKITYMESEATQAIYAATMRQARRIARTGLRYRRRRDRKLYAAATQVEKVIIT